MPKELCLRCKREMRERYGDKKPLPRHVPASNEPIEWSDEYKALVNEVLQAKLKREQREKMDRTGRG